MNRQSIFFTISVSFIISIFLVIISFLILITHDYRMKEGQLLDKYIPVTKMINRQDEIGFDEEFIKSLEEINYKLFIQISEINSITSNPKIKVLFERINP